MITKTLQDLFQGQIDYIFFFKGLAFMLVLAVSILFRGDVTQRLPWRWFGLFALMQGLAAWLSLVALNFGATSPLAIASTVMQIISWVFLAEFGRSGLAKVRNREAGFWLLALLLMLTGLAGLNGWSGIELASRYTLGLVGGLWAASALFMADHNLPGRERGSSLTASISVALFSFGIALFPPRSLVALDSRFNPEFFQQLTGIPLEFVQALLAFGMAAGIYGFLPWRRQAADSQEARSRSRYMFVTLATLSVILGLGSVLTLYLGEWAQKRQEKIRAEAQEYATIVVGRLNTEFKRMEDGVFSLAETPWLAGDMRHLSDYGQERIDNLLDRYCNTLDAAVVYLMDKSGKTIASSNRNAKDSFVGKNYGFRPYFKLAMKGETGRYFAVGVTSKAPGYYVSRPVRSSSTRPVTGAAVIKVSLDNVTQELVTAGQKGNSLICLADPRGVVFLGSHPDMFMKSLWPVTEKDLPDLQQQYGKDQFGAIFPEKIGNGSKVEYLGNTYLASFAGTIHAGWSVFIFRPVEMVGTYRLTGIAVACLLALLALVILGSNFYFRERALSSAGRLKAMFDATPEAIGVVDPNTLQIMEANRSLAALLGYTQQDLLALKLNLLLNQEPEKIRDQLLEIIQKDETTRMDWRVHKMDGSFMDMEAVGSKLEHQGKDQVLIFCRESEAAPPVYAAMIQETGQVPHQVQEPSAPSLLAVSRMDEAPYPKSTGLPPLESKPTNNNAEGFDLEAKKLIKRILEAVDKADKLRKGAGGHLPKS